MTTATERGLAPLRQVLGNGMVVIAKHSPTTPAVTLHASFAAGSIFDPPGHPGLSHFVSRTIDRGTRTQTADQIAEELDSRGVSLGVTLNRHAMQIVCTCLVEHLQVMLGVLADIATRPIFPEAEVSSRRGEIITLIRQDEDNPSAVASEGLMAALYGKDHPYGRSPRGSVESVETIGRAALQGFHAERFRPAALSLVMVGDVTPESAVAAADAAFGSWKGAPPAPLVLPEAAPASERVVRVIQMMNKAQTDIGYGFTSVRRADPSYYAYWLMNNILGQYSLGGRLGDSIRERQGMAYYVFSGLDANVIPGPLMIRAGVSPANVERAVASIDEELTKLAAEGPTEKEVVESKQYLIGSMPRTLETNLGIATFLQTEEFFTLGLDYDLRMPGLLQAVTRDDIHEAARRTLHPSKASVVVAGPYTGQLR
ncbi:MAG: insulinase family protein [Acidobacteria bacterium]|nr:insulinase family protein [Acidobacteriota bacterium]